MASKSGRRTDGEREPEPPPDNLFQAFTHAIWRSRRRKLYMSASLVILVMFSVWVTLPDKSKEAALNRLITSSTTRSVNDTAKSIVHTPPNKARSSEESAGVSDGAVSRPRPALTRLDAEAILQSNRGNIERCLVKLRPGYFYIDFVFTQGDDGAIDADIYPGEKADPWAEFMHPRLRKQEVERYATHDRLQIYARSNKFSVVAPEANGCIMRTLSSEFGHYSLAHQPDGFVHRYITDKALQ